MTPPSVEDALYQIAEQLANVASAINMSNFSFANKDAEDNQHTDYFSVKDAQNLNTLLTDFSCSILGDQGRSAGVSGENKQFVRNCIGELKALANKLAYGVADNH